MIKAILIVAAQTIGALAFLAALYVACYGGCIALNGFDACF